MSSLIEVETLAAKRFAYIAANDAAPAVSLKDLVARARAERSASS